MAGPSDRGCSPGADLPQHRAGCDDDLLFCDVHHAHSALCGCVGRVARPPAVVDAIASGYEPILHQILLVHRTGARTDHRSLEVGTEMVSSFCARSGPGEVAATDFRTAPASGMPVTVGAEPCYALQLGRSIARIVETLSATGRQSNLRGRSWRIASRGQCRADVE